MFEFVDWDSPAAISVSLFEAVVSFFFGDFRVGVLKEIVEIAKGYFVFMLAKTHRIHDFLHIQVHLADVES